MTARKVLLVEDDEALRDSLSEQLDMRGEFRTTCAASGAGALENARRERHELVLLDIGLPDMDGREVCRIMRQVGVKCPIIMLTGADSDADTILGLESGANDYITKPFKIGVLIARMRAQIRQHEQSEDAVFDVGPYVFRPGAKLLTEKAGGRKVRLTEKETSVLRYLYRAGLQAVPRDTLLSEVWDTTPG